MSPTIIAAPLRAVRNLLVIGAVCVAMVLAAVLGAGSAHAQTVSQAAQAKQFAVAMLASVNRERAYHHLPAVKMNAQLLNSAHAHNLEMAKDNAMSHQLPGEAFFGNRIIKAGYNYHYAGENIAWNSERDQTGVIYLEREMFLETPPNDGHRLNILDKNFKDIGIDIYFDNTNDKLWITQDYAQKF